MIQTRTQYFYLLLAAVVYLNVFDLLATLSWCKTNGLDEELNPLMRYFMAINPLTSAAFKFFTVASFVILIQYGSRYNFRLAYRGTFLVVIVYSALLCWHLIGPLLSF